MLGISGIIWSIVCAATFEFARVFQAYDYRTFFKELLGKVWWIYEICYMILLLIVLAVIASSARSILIKYAFYNLGIIPAVLFSVRHVETRKEAIGAISLS